VGRGRYCFACDDETGYVHLCHVFMSGNAPSQEADLPPCFFQLLGSRLNVEVNSDRQPLFPIYEIAVIDNWRGTRIRNGTLYDYLYLSERHCKASCDVSLIENMARI